MRDVNISRAGNAHKAFDPGNVVKLLVGCGVRSLYVSRLRSSHQPMFLCDRNVRASVCVF